MKSTIRHIRMALGAALLCTQSLAAQQSQLQMTSTRLQDDAFVISGFANGNMLVLRSDAGVLLVDAQSARRVTLADSVLHTLVGQVPVRWVVNTHYHSDHVGGNGHFRAQGARVLAHRTVAGEAAKDTTIKRRDGRDWHRIPEPALNLPDTLFDDSLRIRLGKYDVHVYHLVDAHTNGDAMIWIPAANILHAGDIVEINAPPFIDWWTRGHLEGMLRAVDWAMARVNDQTRIIPGHGPVIDRAELLRYREGLVQAGRACPVPADAPTSWACRY